MVKSTNKGVKKIIKISDIVFDQNLYPRIKPNWMTIYDYNESIKGVKKGIVINLSGDPFPPIIIAIHNNKLYLVDGKHRIEAYKQKKIKEVQAIVFTGWSKDKIFKEAVKANITHGHSLSPYEKRRIAVKLLEMKMSNSEVSQLIQISIDKLDNFIQGRLINAVSGEPVSLSDINNAYQIGQVILKSNLQHLAGSTYSQDENIENIQKTFYSRNQKGLLKELITLIETNTLDLGDKEVIKLVTKLKKLLRKVK